jgi:Transglycosylase SLT domain
VVSTAATSGIPAVALAAYQRAAAVIDAADPTCHLPWELIAAIGRVESDHGRTDGNVLTDRGFAHPGIVGPALDGRGTSLVRDTDAGRYDRDVRYDRAVGPMQFIPSTWSIVGVDADNDGRRDPQDIYDASLASAVYLCSGTDDLATAAGQRAAVFRYNHNQEYVALVLAIEHAYLAGDFTSVPNGTTTSGSTFGTTPLVAVMHDHQRHAGHHGRHHARDTGPGSTTSGGTPTSGPTANPTSGSTSGTGVPAPGPTGSSTGLPSPPTGLPTDLPTSVLTGVLTQAQAIAQCLAQGLVDDPLDPDDAFDRCVDDLTQ